jgi:hypothetical protein
VAKPARLLVALLVAACSSGNQPTGVASQARTPQATPPATSQPLSGRMPVELFDLGASNSQLSGGFFDLATRTFAVDTGAQLTPVQHVRPATHDSSSLERTNSQPYLYGTQGGKYGYANVTYDAPVGRWLPVSRKQVAPDGLSYVYTEEFYGPLPAYPSGAGGCCPAPTGGTIHIADAASGQDKLAVSFSGWPDYQPIRYAADGIYMEAECNGPAQGCDELWRLDPTTGKLSLAVATQGAWWSVDGGNAWFVTPLGNGPIEAIQLIRVDLHAGAVETWFNLSAGSATNGNIPSMVILGTDGDGLPWVALNSRSPSPLLRFIAPNQSQQMFDADGPYSELVTDRNGTWFAVVDNASPTPATLGLYRFTPSSDVSQVSALHILPA